MKYSLGHRAPKQRSNTTMMSPINTSLHIIDQASEMTGPWDHSPKTVAKGVHSVLNSTLKKSEVSHQ